MKAERWICGLWGMVLSFCAAFGAVGGLVSGLNLREDMGLLALIYAVMAAVTAACCVFRLYLLPLGGLLVVSLLFWKPLLASARFLVSHAGALYDLAYHWGVPVWPDGEVQAHSAMWLLAILGGCVICLVVTAVLSGRGLKAGALMALLPLIPCIIVTDTVPETIYLFLTLLSIVFLLLSDNVRAGSLRKGNTLMLGLVLPTLLGLALLFVLVPREGYDGQEGAQKLEDFVVSLLEDPEGIEKPPLVQTPVQEIHQTELDLSDVGYNPALGVRVMSVRAQTTGTMYLRGSIYDVYTGTGWHASGTQLGNNVYSVAQGQSRQLTVRTARIHDVLYVPYVTEQITGKLVDGQLPNPEKLREYTVTYREPATLEVGVSKPVFGLTEFRETFCQLPPETRSWAVDYSMSRVRHLVDSGRIREAAVEIGDLVRSSARYDRMTSAMPRNETDFVRWFLEERDTGYCTHFASLAVVLLRGADIPARYVTGYLVQTQAGEFVEVTTDDAHAWVEYYVPSLGWVVLEVTPAAEQSPVPPPVTEPSATDVPTEGTQAPAPSLSQNTTAPSDAATPSSGVGQPDEPTDSGPASTDAETPKKPRELPDWVVTVALVSLAILGLIAVVIGQWRLRLWLRVKAKNHGKTNARLLRRWQEAEQLCRLLKQQPPEALHQLALKARFSQHTVSSRELAEFDLALEELQAILRAKPWYCQLLYRLVLALY